MRFVKRHDDIFGQACECDAGWLLRRGDAGDEQGSDEQKNGAK